MCFADNIYKSYRVLFSDSVIGRRPVYDINWRKKRKNKRSAIENPQDKRFCFVKFEFQSNDRFLGFIISIFFHLLVLILLALMVFQQKIGTLGVLVDAQIETAGPDLEMIDETGTDLQAETKIETVKTDLESETPVVISDRLGQEARRISDPIPVPVPSMLAETIPADQQPGGMPLLQVSGLTKGRTEDSRKHGLPGRAGDTTKESEDAVERGLAWLAAHQYPDGGWSFDLAGKDFNGRSGPCNGACSNTHNGAHHDPRYRAGLHPSRTAATAMALLPFYGAGYTHLAPDGKGNKYQKTIADGINFLKYRAVMTKNGYDFRQGLLGQGMYIQGIVVLALCEAYEMTGDETLRSYAQQGVRFIEMAQRSDGGWRYHTPQDTDFIKDVSGDTAVTGWQVMALKSAVSAGLTVHPGTLYKVSHFLDTVQNDDGSLYHYLPIKNENSTAKMYATTAIGLLLRQYLGWRSDHNGMKRGTAHLVKWLNESNRDWEQIKKGNFLDGKRQLAVNFGEKDRKLFVYNVYFSFYAALALQNIGGSDWQKSFPKLRELIIENQVKGIRAGHENGSWLFHDLYLNDGGRLLNTALAVLVLETPYRYLPLYRQ